MLFDFVFVFIVALAVNLCMQEQVSASPSIWIMFPILLLYGSSAMLLGYVLSHFVSGPLKTFLATICVSLIMFLIGSVGFGVSVQGTLIMP